MIVDLSELYGERCSTIIDLTDNCIILGKDKSNRSNLMINMILALSKKYSKNDIEIKIIKSLDFNNNSFTCNEYKSSFSHVSEIMTVESLEDFSLALDYIIYNIGCRKEIFDKRFCCNIEEFNIKNPDGRLPVSIIFIDDIGKVNNIESDEVRNKLDMLFSISKAFGVYFICADQLHIKMYKELYLKYFPIKSVLNTSKDMFNDFLIQQPYIELNQDALLVDDGSNVTFYKVPYVGKHCGFNK